MSRPRTLAEIRAEVRKKGVAKLTAEEQAMTLSTLEQEMKREIDGLYLAMSASYFAYAEGLGPLPPLTWRQRLRVWSWRLRRGLAWPFVRVVRWLDPSELRQDD